jgi:glycine oxidase
MVACPLQIEMKIAIVGGGSAGLFTAWYLAKMGHGAEVTLFDRGEPGHGTTWKAAGMLAPVHEIEFQELDLMRAGIASRDLYFHEVAPSLGEIGLRHYGSLEVGLGQDDTAYLRRQFEFQQSQGLDVEWLTGAMIQEVEPFVSKNIGQAIWSHKDTQVDNWLLVRRLVEQLRMAGVGIRPNSLVQDWIVSGSGTVNLRVNDQSESFDKVLFALGVPSADLETKLPYQIYPVRGEMVCLETPQDDFPSTQVRIVSKVLGNAYVVPKMDRILCGSTSEEKGLEMVNTAGGLLNILRKCHAVIPAIYEMNVQEIWSGLRPSTLNRLPILAQERDSPIFHLNGLYRHGILLGPLMGKSAAKMLLGQERLPETRPFDLALAPKSIQ